MWTEVASRWRWLPHNYDTSSRVTGLDPFGRAVRPKQRLGTFVTHLSNSWTGMTHQCMFENHSHFTHVLMFNIFVLKYKKVFYLLR
jgi:hypothetical protein